MTFGEKLQGLRQRAEMSQDALAEKLNVSRQAVSRWERDETMPETDKVVALAELFGVTTDYLLRERTGERREPCTKETGREQREGFFQKRLGKLARILGWTAVIWGALDLLYLVLTGDLGEIFRYAPGLLLRAFLYPTLLAVLKITAGIVLIRFGNQYEQDKKERR